MYTNLHLAAFAGDVRIVLDCVRGNNGFPQCGIDETDEQGFTALMYAAKSGNSAVVSKLLELGCDANILNNDGMSALQMCNPAVKELLVQHSSIHPSPSMPISNAAPVNSPTAVASPVPMHFSPTFLPGSSAAGSGAFSVPGRHKDRSSQSDGSSHSQLDATVSSSQSSSANIAHHRPAAFGASSPSSSRHSEAQIQVLQSKLSDERAARLASDAVADDLNRQLQARDAIIEELHKQLQLLEQQLFSVMSTLERSAEDALHVERSIKSKNPSSDNKRRLLVPQLQQQQLRQDPSPSRQSSSNGSAFAPSVGIGAPTASMRSPALPSSDLVQETAFDGQSTTFIKPRPIFADSLGGFGPNGERIGSSDRQTSPQRWVQSPTTSGLSGGGSRYTSPALASGTGDGSSASRSASFIQMPTQRSPASGSYTLKPSSVASVTSPSPPPHVPSHHHQQMQQPSNNRMVRSTGSMPSAAPQRNTPSPTVQIPPGSAGVGLRLLLDSNSELVVTEVTPGGGCDDTRMVQSGDVLVAVNGRNVRGSSIQAVAQVILGPIGSSCHLVLRRKGIAFSVSASRKRPTRN